MTGPIDVRFNEALDEEYPALHVPVLKARRLASELLATLDPQLYATRRDEWLTSQLEMAMGKDILPPPHVLKNLERFQRLASLTAKQRVIPFIGAGVSASAGVPTWSAFLRKLANEHAYSTRILNTQLAQGLFEKAASGLLAHMGEAAFRESFDRCFDRSNESTVHSVIGAIGATFAGPMITTNYDQLLERSLFPVFAQTFLGRL